MQMKVLHTQAHHAVGAACQPLAVIRTIAYLLGTRRTQWHIRQRQQTLPLSLFYMREVRQKHRIGESRQLTAQHPGRPAGEGSIPRGECRVRWGHYGQMDLVMVLAPRGTLVRLSTSRRWEPLAETELYWRECPLVWLRLRARDLGSLWRQEIEWIDSQKASFLWSPTRTTPASPY